MVKTKNILFIDDLIVDKNYRNKGLGQLLLLNIFNYAKEINCQTIELKAYIENKNAHKLYEKNGFKRNHFAFKKNL